jgi:hypothetical protein
MKIEEGLLSMNLEDDIKYEICCFFHSICDLVLRYRVEAITSFSNGVVADIQADQKKRYSELKESTLPNAIIAKKTREFRMQARDQMFQLVTYKSTDLEIAEHIKASMQAFHECLNKLARVKERVAAEVVEVKDESGIISKVFRTLFCDNSASAPLEAIEPAAAEAPEAAEGADPATSEEFTSKNICLQISLVFFLGGGM